VRAQRVVHAGRDERKRHGEDGAEDDGGGDRARAVDRVGVHEVLDERLHDLRGAGAEGDACQDGEDPRDGREASPDRFASPSAGDVGAAMYQNGLTRRTRTARWGVTLLRSARRTGGCEAPVKHRPRG
jgi:hypothetical protein